VPRALIEATDARPANFNPERNSIGFARPTLTLDALMILRLFKISIVALALLLSSLAVHAQTASTDPLKPYTACKVPGGLKIKEVTRRTAGDNYREVTTDDGKKRVSVLDGYRVMSGYPDLPYFFANVKIEQSDPASYLQDKEILINEKQHYATIKEATAMVFTDKRLFNGFEDYGFDREKIDVGGQVAVHVLFYDSVHLVVTVYFLNQSKAVFANNRRFETVKQFRELRDDFLSHYSECLKRVAEAGH
jgi:hypothetical protein